MKLPKTQNQNWLILCVQNKRISCGQFDDYIQLSFVSRFFRVENKQTTDGENIGAGSAGLILA